MLGSKSPWQVQADGRWDPFIDGEKDTHEGQVQQTIENIVQNAESTQIIALGSGAGNGRLSKAQALIPYINSFEAALAEHQKLRETLQSRVELLNASIEEGAGDLHVRIQAMGEAFTGLFSSFKEMELSFERSQSVATTSGKLIEGLCRMKRRSRDAKELFVIFSDIAGGKGLGKLEAILGSTAPETREHGAKLMRRLKMLSEAQIEGAEEATKVMTRLAKDYEERLLIEFQAAFEQNQLNEMRVAASLLITLNGGQSCVQSFVSQHAFFSEPVPVEYIRTRHAVPLTLVLSEGPTAEKVLLELYEQIAETVEADWSYMEAVFEDPFFVMNCLMQRIFQEPLKAHLDEILRQARTHSDWAYLRCLFASFRATKDLVARLQQSYEKHLKAAAARSTSDLSAVDEKIASVQAHLRAITLELFSSHLRLPEYFVLEQSVTKELLTQIVGTNAGAGGRTTKPTPRNAISSVFGLSTPSSPVQTTSPRTTEVPDAPRFSYTKDEPLLVANGEPGLPSQDVIKRCLTVHAESSARLFLLLPSDVRGERLEQSIKALLSLVLEKYIEACLDVQLSKHESGARAFDRNAFVVVKAACQGLALVLEYFRAHVLPLIVTASSGSYRTTVLHKTEVAARVTEKIDRVLRSELGSSLKYIEESLLGKQRRSDYKPRPDDMEALVGPSQVCCMARETHTHPPRLSSPLCRRAVQPVSMSPS